MTKYTYSEWIEHDGKGMPVDGETIVEVEFTDMFISTPKTAKFWNIDSSNWVDDEDPDNFKFNIIAYRIATPIHD